jgi:hypothetical protein
MRLQVRADLTVPPIRGCLPFANLFVPSEFLTRTGDASGIVDSNRSSERGSLSRSGCGSEMRRIIHLPSDLPACRPARCGGAYIDVNGRARMALYHLPSPVGTR